MRSKYWGVLDSLLFFAALALFSVWGGDLVQGGIWNWLGPIGMAWFIGRVLVAFGWGIWWSRRTGTPLRWGYGGWYVSRRRRRR